MKLTCPSKSPFKKKYTPGVLDGMLMCVCCMENVMRLAEKKKLARAHNEQQLDRSLIGC